MRHRELPLAIKREGLLADEPFMGPGTKNHLTTIGLTLSTTLVVLACATNRDPGGRGQTAYRLGSEPAYNWNASRAPAAAFGADSFTFRKSQPVGQTNDFLFYYKHCSENGESTYYSKTAYDCTGP